MPFSPHVIQKPQHNLLAGWLTIGQGIGMEQLHIKGSTAPLHGRVDIGGSKNAALPIIAASLLSAQPVSLHRVPRVSDVSSMLHLLQHLGSEITPADDGVTLYTPHVETLDAPYELVRKMRTSILVLGPLLARFGRARVSMPGGCAIGARPIGMHLEGLRQMGAEISLGDGYADAHVVGGRLQGAEITLRFPSVGATQNLLMAATLADGETILYGGAKEPEITDLADFLTKMGAHITGVGTDEIHIMGQPELEGGVEHYTIPVDRVQAASYALLVAATGGQAKIGGMDMASLGNCGDIFAQMGVRLRQADDHVEVSAQTINAVDIVTAPFPGYPTDIQAQTMALLLLAEGSSSITERIFENRFMHVPELQRMGADIRLEGDRAMINSLPQVKRFPLSGAEVMATDIRASFCLIIIGLVAQGVTRINRLYHLDRGYENLTQNLQKLGANVERYRT